MGYSSLFDNRRLASNWWLLEGTKLALLFLPEGDPLGEFSGDDYGNGTLVLHTYWCAL